MDNPKNIILGIQFSIIATGNSWEQIVGRWNTETQNDAQKDEWKETMGINSSSQNLKYFFLWWKIPKNIKNLIQELLRL